MVLLNTPLGIKLSPEEEHDGADLSIHKISSTPRNDSS
jgi:ammonia channel protein AmtB